MAILEKVAVELKLHGYSARTVKSYNFMLRKFFEYSGKEPENLTSDDARAFLAHLVDDDNPHQVSVRSMALAKAALRFLFKEVLRKPADLPENIQIPKKLPVVLTKDEISAILDNTKNKKHKMLIEFLYSAGLRVSELVSLQAKDLDLRDGIGWARAGKGAKDRIFILSEKLKPKIEKIIAGKQPDSHIFEGRNGKLTVRAVQSLIKSAAKRAGINKKVSPHTMRHSFATHLLEAGVDVRKIQELLGHADLSTTQIYTKVSTAELKKIKSPLDNL